MSQQMDETVEGFCKLLGTAPEVTRHLFRNDLAQHLQEDYRETVPELHSLEVEAHGDEHRALCFKIGHVDKAARFQRLYLSDPRFHAQLRDYGFTRLEVVSDQDRAEVNLFPN